MRKTALFCLVFSLFVFSSVWAYSINLGSSEDGAQVKLISADDFKVRVEVKIPEIQVEDEIIEGMTYQHITIPGGGWLTQVGDPQVPLVCRFVALPPASGVRMEVVEQEKETLPGTFVIYPFQKPPLRSGSSEPQVFEKNQEVYSQARPFPGNPVEKGEILILRDLRLAAIKFFPIQFNPQTGAVEVYRRLVVDIYFEGTGENPQGAPTQVLTRSFLKTYQRFVLNFDQIKGGKAVVDGSILIITYDDFHAQVQALADWKHKMGYETYLVNKSSVGTTTTQIRNYIYDAYHNWTNPPEYVILVGDAAQIPTYTDGVGGCITDHKYATVDGTDYFADLSIARISVQTQAEAAHVITKILNYRKNPYTTQTQWFRKAMTISGSDYVDDQNANRCGRLMVDYANFTSFDSLWGSLGTNTVTQITNRLNEGRSWLVYFGHGSATSWASTSPSFTNSHIDALSNGEKLPAIFDVACNNAEFTYSGGDCFGERWIKAGSVGNEKGAVIICASTNTSAFFYSDTLGRGTFIAYFQDSLYHFTPAVNQGKMYMYQYFPESAGGTTEREMQMYTTFGDPELDPWTGIPETLLVDFPSTIPMAPSDVSIIVQKAGGPVNGALVCLRKGTEVFESGYTNASGQVTLAVSPTTPGNLELTVTAHNVLPLEDSIMVIPGSYVLFDRWYIDDDSLGESFGNSDGDVDLGETIELPIVLKNLGDSTALDVVATLSTTNPFITISDSQEIYGNIPAHDTARCPDDFGFVVSPQIEDSELVTFQLDITATNGNWTWRDLNLLVHAPVLVYDSRVINEIGGNGNGQPDPGETCDMTVVLKNRGSQKATQVSGDLVSSDPYVTVTAGSSEYPDIPPGSTVSSLVPYRFNVHSNCPPGHVTAFVLEVSGEGPYSASDTFLISIGRKPVLLVDDDDGESFDTFFVSALDSSGILCDVWNHKFLGSPSDSVLSSYNAVVWTTGEDFGSIGNPSTLTAQDQANLQAYLEGGGKLFLSSQDLLFDNNPNDFIINYLHVAAHTDDQGVNIIAGVPGDTISDGMAISLSYPFSNLSDYIVAGSGAAGIFYRTGKNSPSSRDGILTLPSIELDKGHQTNNYCALRYPAEGSANYQVVFFAFPFEAIPQNGTNPNNAKTVMERIMNWFGIAKPSFLAGDANADGQINASDVVYLINYLFVGGPEPQPWQSGDANCDGALNVSDVIYLINYLFIGGPAPGCE
jgi:hypothetical protein